MTIIFYQCLNLKQIQNSKFQYEEEIEDDQLTFQQEFGMKKKSKKKRIHFPLPDWAENVPKDVSEVFSQ